MYRTGVQLPPLPPIIKETNATTTARLKKENEIIDTEIGKAEVIKGNIESILNIKSTKDSTKKV